MGCGQKRRVLSSPTSRSPGNPAGPGVRNALRLSPDAACGRFDCRSQRRGSGERNGSVLNEQAYTGIVPAAGGFGWLVRREASWWAGDAKRVRKPTCWRTCIGWLTYQSHSKIARSTMAICTGLVTAPQRSNGLPLARPMQGFGDRNGARPRPAPERGTSVETTSRQASYDPLVG